MIVKPDRISIAIDLPDKCDVGRMVRTCDGALWTCQAKDEWSMTSVSPNPYTVIPWNAAIEQPPAWTLWFMILAAAFVGWGIGRISTAIDVHRIVEAALIDSTDDDEEEEVH